MCRKSYISLLDLNTPFSAEFITMREGENVNGSDFGGAGTCNMTVTIYQTGVIVSLYTKSVFKY